MTSSLLQTSTFAVRGVSANGDVVFYTGKAGDGWVSANLSDAFTYGLEGARAKAAVFNRATELHGLRFVAYATADDQES